VIADITMNDGAIIPQVGFGTLNLSPDRTPSERNISDTADIVGVALDVGYRLIDTAQMYGNEAGVGRAVATCGIPRSDLVITSKLGNANHRPDDVRHSFDQRMTYRANHRRQRSSAGRQPDRGAPYFRNEAARAACAGHGVVVEAWSPLGRGVVLSDPVIGRIAEARHRTPAQVVLRWHIQHGHVIIPKSTHRQRIEENFRLFDFELSDEEMAAIDALDRGSDGRIGPHPDTFAWLP
jgi:2,5-diketo-D-gluconate reductase A